MFNLTFIAQVLFVTTAINLVVTYISWQRRKSKGGLYFSLGMISITFWTLAAGFDYAAVEVPVKVFFATLEAWGYMIALPMFALFTLSFAGYEHMIEKNWVKALFILIPVSNILLISTNGLHGWVWDGFIQSEGNIVIFEHGTAFKWITINGYLTMFVILAALWIAIRKGSDVTRRQGRLLLGATLFPLIANVAYQFLGGGVKGVDWTSVTFSVTGLLFLLALYGTRFMDIVPIAREKLMSSLGDGMIVLDTQNRIIDINDIAADMIGAELDTLLGKKLADFFSNVDPLSESVDDELRTELIFEKTDKRFFDVLVSPLYEGKRNKLLGRLIIARDITERKQAGLLLEERLLEIQELHQSLQDSQAQLLEQQRALAVEEERQRMARNLHDSITQSINGMVLFSDTLASALEKGNLDHATRIMQRLRESARQSLKEARLMLYQWQDSGPERSTNLIQGLEDRIAAVESRVGVRTQLIHEGSLEHCPVEWHENLYWLAVEALNNALKHAQARSVEIVIRCSPERLELEVIDDGIGFDIHKVEVGRMGLKNLRDRADIIGGMLNIKSSPSKGTTVRFFIEIKA